jgi:hypothetical protein
LVDVGNRNKNNVNQKAKMQAITSEIDKSKKAAQPKTEEEKVMELIGTKNEGAKDKKLKELIQKNKELLVALEKEKTLY